MLLGHRDPEVCTPDPTQATSRLICELTPYNSGEINLFFLKMNSFISINENSRIFLNKCSNCIPASAEGRACPLSQQCCKTSSCCFQAQTHQDVQTVKWVLNTTGTNSPRKIHSSAATNDHYNSRLITDCFFRLVD